MLAINHYLDHYIALWENSSTSFPLMPKTYTNSEKREREEQCLLFQAKIKEQRSLKVAKHLHKGPGTPFFPLFRSFLASVFDFETEQLNIILSDDFKKVSNDFFYKARQFDSDLKLEDIYQGLRNVWIMNGIQLMAGLKVNITPSVFAYSLIYPYSDNYLDNPSISTLEKQLFSERFEKRLKGHLVKAESHTERQLYKLVAMFEEEFDRDDFPQVYESLYAIHKAQTDSLHLLKAEKLNATQVQRICFEKGGTSVLADGYLVAGKLTQMQEQALFAYGIYLQLLDDIQDLKEDAETDTRTMFSCLKQEDRSAMVNKTIHFGREVIDELRCLNETCNDDFIQLMKQSIEMMMIESVGLNNDWYSSPYSQEMEKHSPLNYAFLRQKRGESKSQRLAVFQKYFSV